MNILFIHQNFPGQFGRLAARLAATGHTVLAIGDESQASRRPPVPGVRRLAYSAPGGSGPQTHAYLRRLEADVRRGQEVVRLALRLRASGFVPDLIYGNPGWGELMFIKDVFPDAPLVALYEFYFRPGEGDHGFDEEFPTTFDSNLRLRVRNATLALTLDRVDAIVAPTQWQASRLPGHCASRLSVIHDGIDTDLCRPDPGAVFRHPSLPSTLTAADEVITYVARNLEPYRGFHKFMRALPGILDRRPQAKVVVVGGDEVSYGAPPREGGCWRETLLAELGDRLDRSRVHFVGRLPYADFITLMQVSAAHVYLTYPFVLSWSVLEAMACGALVVGSATPPVTEVIEDRHTGLLTAFDDPAAIGNAVVAALERRHALDAIRVAARARVVERYDFERVCGHAQVALLERLVGARC